MDVRKFALLAIDDFDVEIARFDLDYAETPKNLGFELDFTKIESSVATQFTSIKEKKLSPSMNINFLPPNAYEKLNKFKAYVQRHLRHRMVFEYNDTTDEIKYIEGKIQRLGQEELQDWGGLTCPIVFVPSTPKYIRKKDAILIGQSVSGKSYPFAYPYSYGNSITSSGIIENTYFDDIPLRIEIYGVVSNPTVALQDAATGEVYSTVRFEGLYLGEGERLIIDSMQSKILLHRGGEYKSAYDYVGKQSHLDTFLYLKGGSDSRMLFHVSPQETGYLTASYYQYVL